LVEDGRSEANLDDFAGALEAIGGCDQDGLMMGMAQSKVPAATITTTTANAPDPGSVEEKGGGGGGGGASAGSVDGSDASHSNTGWMCKNRPLCPFKSTYDGVVDHELACTIGGGGGGGS
jgi:hypothetical protein